MFLASIRKRKKRLNAVIRGARVFSNIAAADSYHILKGKMQNLKSTFFQGRD
jgi:hypothetical protein